MILASGFFFSPTPSREIFSTFLIRSVLITSMLLSELGLTSRDCTYPLIHHNFSGTRVAVRPWHLINYGRHWLSLFGKELWNYTILKFSIFDISLPIMFPQTKRCSLIEWICYNWNTAKIQIKIFLISRFKRCRETKFSKIFSLFWY